MDQLVKEIGLSKRTLQRMFAQYLSQPHKLSVYPSEKVNLIIDGTYFTRDLCLILYRDNASQSNGQIDRKKSAKTGKRIVPSPKPEKKVRMAVRNAASEIIRISNQQNVLIEW